MPREARPAVDVDDERPRRVPAGTGLRAVRPGGLRHESLDQRSIRRKMFI